MRGNAHQIVVIFVDLRLCEGILNALHEVIHVAPRTAALGCLWLGDDDLHEAV